MKIKYELSGHKYLTPCPNGKTFTIKTIVMPTHVASNVCKAVCKHFISNDEIEDELECSYDKEE